MRILILGGTGAMGKELADIASIHGIDTFVTSRSERISENWRYEGYADKVSKERTPFRSIKNYKDKIRYFLARYTFYYERRKRN